MDLKVFRYLFPIDFQVWGNKWLCFSYDRTEKHVHLLCVLYYFTDYNSDTTNAKWLYTHGVFPQKLYWSGPQACVLLPTDLGITVVRSVITEFLYLQNAVCCGPNSYITIILEYFLNTFKIIDSHRISPATDQSVSKR